MSLLIDLTIRTSVIALIGLAATALVRRRSAALRHVILVATLAGAVMVVPLRLFMPAWGVRMPASVTPAVVSATQTVGVDTTLPERSPDTRTAAIRLMPIAWAFGVALGLVTIVSGLGRLVWLGARAETVRGGPWAHAAEQVRQAYGLRRSITLLQTETSNVLATWGAWHPRILLPAQARHWDQDRIHIVLCHELAHIRRGDWLVQLGSEALRAVYWFNPLLWLVCSRLRQESEQACDDVVLRMGVTADAYAAHLLDIARGCRPAGAAWASASSMTRPSTLERRIAAMLNPALDRAALSPRAIALTAVLLTAITLPSAALRAAQTNPLPLEGTVYDVSGAVVPGVELVLEVAGQPNRQATTDAVGRFRFDPVPPGSHVLSAALPGFRQLRQGIELRQAGDWERAVTLQVGAVSETISVKAVRGAGQPPSSARPTPLRVGGVIRPPIKEHDVRPVFPESMRDAGREGVVPIEALIGGDGSVHSVRVLSAHVHPDFVIAAVDAVRQWRFEPTLLNGEPVEVAMTVTINFSLSNQ